MDGNARYAANAPLPKDYAAGRAARALAQHPITGILACADSRVPPEIAFDQRPGELFVVRVAGNFVNDHLRAGLACGTVGLGVPLLMVLGHSGCGATDAKPTNRLDAATVENVRANVERLRSATPVVAELVTSGKVEVVRAVYDIATGKVSMV